MSFMTVAPYVVFLTDFSQSKRRWANIIAMCHVKCAFYDQNCMFHLNPEYLWVFWRFRPKHAPPILITENIKLLTEVECVNVSRAKDKRLILDIGYLAFHSFFGCLKIKIMRVRFCVWHHMCRFGKINVYIFVNVLTRFRKKSIF